MLKNLQKKKIIHDLFNAENEFMSWDEIKIGIILKVNFIANGHKLSIQFPELENMYSKKVKVTAQICYCLINNYLK